VLLVPVSKRERHIRCTRVARRHASKATSDMVLIVLAHRSVKVKLAVEASHLKLIVSEPWTPNSDVGLALLVVTYSSPAIVV